MFILNSISVSFYLILKLFQPIIDFYKHFFSWTLTFISDGWSEGILSFLVTLFASYVALCAVIGVPIMVLFWIWVFIRKPIETARALYAIILQNGGEFIAGILGGILLVFGFIIVTGLVTGIVLGAIWLGVNPTFAISFGIVAVLILLINWISAGGVTEKVVSLSRRIKSSLKEINALENSLYFLKLQPKR